MKPALILVPLLAAGMLGMSGCTSVQYGDATAVETVNTDFGSTDLQMIAEKMVDDMLASGAVAQIKDQTVEFRPMRSRPEDTEVVVRTLVRNKGEAIQLDYRLEKADGGWKIYDVNVLGAWLVQTYQSSFAQEVSASGIDGLIAKLVERNKQLASRKVAG